MPLVVTRTCHDASRRTTLAAKHHTGTLAARRFTAANSAPFAGPNTPTPLANADPATTFRAGTRPASRAPSGMPSGTSTTLSIGTRTTAMPATGLSGPENRLRNYPPSANPPLMPRPPQRSPRASGWAGVSTGG